MNIIEVEYLGPPAVGGVEMVVETLSRRFIAAGHEVQIWCTNLAAFGGNRHREQFAAYNGIPICRFPAQVCRLFLLDPYHLRWIGLKQALIEQARAGAVIHLHPFPSSQAMTALAALEAGGTIVITPHHEVESLRRYRRLWRGKRSLSKLLSAARRFPRLRLGLHTELEAKYWREEVGWPEKQMRVIPNGVDLQEFDQLSATELEEAKNLWPPGKMRLLFVGRLTEAKGIDTLLHALPRNETVSLLVVGPDAGELPKLKALTAELELESRVNFSGALPRRQVCAAFRACDIFLLLSRFGENFGIAAIEAMAAGKPVIASDCGGLPTLIKSEKNGLIFPAESVGDLGKAIERMTGSEQLRQTLGEAGRRMVEAEYTWEHVVQEYLELFSSTT